MKYNLFFLFILFLFIDAFAGKELWHPTDKLYEFMASRNQIMTHIKCCRNYLEEDNQWYQKFEKLWYEVEQTEEIFNNYFITNKNETTMKQKKVYDDFKRALAKDKNNLTNLVAPHNSDIFGEPHSAYDLSSRPQLR